ncbi:hypothetical protein [Thiocystis violacea]|uniref:hypothetical protein n=1 Tax=Thiocystis violacea TaxID=13725 RepID=UPI00190869A1|nr:hypothetical protein [Thiocystis violacea]MBK1719649.1 hypothetical protein [Thiocystis violacea]
MMLETYEKEERFWLKTLFGATSKPGLLAFRGEFVVLEGELKSVAGKRAPPKALIKQAVLLADTDKLHLVAGNFASVEELPEFVAHFKGDLAADAVPLFYIDNLAENCQVEIEGQRYVLIQFHEGLVWNELMEAFYVDKADLKGMSGEDKVVVVHEASKDYRPDYPLKTLEDVLATKTDAKRMGWGAV